MRITAKAGDRTYEITGSVLSMIPLRNRRKTPEGEQLVTRISEGMTEWKWDGKSGYGLSEYLDQIVDGAPVGARVPVAAAHSVLLHRSRCGTARSPSRGACRRSSRRPSAADGSSTPRSTTSSSARTRSRRRARAAVDERQLAEVVARLERDRPASAHDLREPDSITWKRPPGVPSSVTSSSSENSSGFASATTLRSSTGVRSTKRSTCASSSTGGWICGVTSVGGYRRA